MEQRSGLSRPTIRACHSPCIKPSLDSRTFVLYTSFNEVGNPTYEPLLAAASGDSKEIEGDV